MLRGREISRQARDDEYSYTISAGIYVSYSLILAGVCSAVELFWYVADNALRVAGLDIVSVLGCVAGGYTKLFGTTF